MITEVMNTVYDWVNHIVNNTVVPSPGIEIIPSHENTPAPSGIYITIDYTPALATLGQADWIVEDEGGTVYKTLRVSHEGTVEIWETNGNGEYLSKLLRYQWIEEINNILRDKNISVLRNGEVISIPSIKPDDRWQKESVVEIVFGFGAGIKFEMDDITNIEASGTLTKDDGSERDVEIT